jgi:bifunctional enzyme CysN/CysC
MVTGASTADLAVILIDARKGVLTQTRRHSYLVSLLGIRKSCSRSTRWISSDYSEQAFRDIERDYRTFAAQIGFSDITAIPVSAVRGDNVVTSSSRMPWYGVRACSSIWRPPRSMDSAATRPFRLPVQWVNRPNAEFRGFAGMIASGAVRTGDRLRVLPSGRTSSVARILSAGADTAVAVAGESVTLTLTDEVDVSRGDVLAAAELSPTVADQFEATIIWMHDEPLLQGRTYLLQSRR